MDGPQPPPQASSAGVGHSGQMESHHRLSKLPPAPLPGTFTSIQRKSFTKQISNGATDTETLTSTHHQVRRVPILRSISTTPQSLSSHLESSSSSSSVRHQRTSSTPVTGSSFGHSSNSSHLYQHNLPNVHSNQHLLHQQQQQQMSKLSGSLEKLDAPFLGSAIDQLASTALRMANLRLQSAIGGKGSHLPIDRYSSSSGYDSNNSNSSLTHYLVNGGGGSTTSSSTSNNNNNNSNTVRRIPSLHSFNNKFGTGRGSGLTNSDQARASISSSNPTSNSHPNPSAATTTTFNASRRNSNSSLRSNCSSSSTATTTASKRYSYGSGKDIKEEVIHSLDRLEVRVAFLREVAAELLAERTKLTDALAQIESCCTVNTFSEADLADIQAAVEMLRNRLSAVEITIRTLRSPVQAEALQTATAAIDELQGQLLLNNSANNSNHSQNQPPNIAAAKRRCLSYISSCSSDTLESSCSTGDFTGSGGDGTGGVKSVPQVELSALLQVPIDERFQKTVIQCSLDDQKTIKRRLQAILKAIDGQQPLSTTVGQTQQHQHQ